jgi:hypothetical protein
MYYFLEKLYRIDIKMTTSMKHRSFIGEPMGLKDITGMNLFSRLLI